VSGPTCSRCRRAIDAHEATDCLNRWIHELRGLTLSEDHHPPSYSEIGEPLDQVVEANRWPADSFVISRLEGWIVVSSGTEVSRSDSFGLAVCRAALKLFPAGGKEKLTVMTPLQH